MGRYSYSGRLVADTLKTISIYWLKKKKYLIGGYVGGTMTWSRDGEETGSISMSVNIDDDSSWMNLSYKITRFSSGKVDRFDYKVPIVSTKCFFGGKRYWFVCSASRNGVLCNRRIAKLFQGQDYFACRHCYHLTYQSRRENPTYRKYPYNVLNLSMKAEELEKGIKKRFYKGKETKKYKRIMKLLAKFNSFDEFRAEMLLYKHN